MANTFFFYDLETSGLSAREDRIMQFAGQRTDMELNPIDEPVNVLVALNDDTLPSPEALMVTGISPQQTVDEGYTEAQFTKLLMDDVFTADTIAVGFNNVRFDDEFVRHLLWRNFYDPYEWAWRDGRSRWDLLDAVRMTRALRPDGIEWPVDAEGNATNRLELITKANGIDHEKAHDAMSDVEALIAVTRLIRERQPDLYTYLLKMRDKNEVKRLVNLDNKKPFVYVSGRYDAEYNKATVAFPLTSAPNGNVLVYDLRYDPSEFVTRSEKDLADMLFATREQRQADGFVKLPVKQLQYNRCPAVAPLGVLASGNGWERIGLDEATIHAHMQILTAHPEFAERLRTVYERTREYPPSNDPEAQLYDGFVNDRDRLRIETVRNATERELADFQPEFNDERLPPLLLHYKARNYPRSLSEAEARQWEVWRSARIAEKLPQFMASIQRIAATNIDEHARFVLEELQLWAESIMPSGDD